MSAGPAAAAPVAPGTEVISERTRFSRTYRNADQDDRFTTRVSEQPINFSTDGGDSWKTIDNTVVPASGGFVARNAANAFDARLPHSLDEPVRVEADGRWVSFALLGAATDAPVLEGDTATYVVSPQVKASYTMHGAGVREALTLATATAPHRFTYRVDASAALTPTITAEGGVVFTEPDDRVRFGFAAPTLIDANGVVGRAAFALERDGTRWTLTLTADATWLADPARAFPVVLDPDVYWVDGLLRFSKADQDCYLDSAAATTTTCSLPTLKVGKTATGEQKSVLRFAVEDAIPPDAQVLEGWLGLYVQTRAGSSSSFGVELHRLTEPWTNAATWNTSNGSQAWAGTATDAAIEGPVRTMGSAGFWTAWEPTELVQKWISGAIPNHGFVLKPTAGAPQTQFTLTSSDGTAGYAPYIDVDWQPSVGQAGHYTYLTAPSTATHNVQVNPANGNVLVKATDATLNGFAEGYARTFNAQGTWTTWGPFGPGWTSGIGSGIYMGTPDWDGSIQVETPDGASLTFHQNSNGSFRSPKPTYASLTANTGGTYTLHLNDGGTSGTDYTVYPDPASWAARSATRDGNTLSVTAENGSTSVRTITDGTKTLTQDRDSVGIVSLAEPGVGTTSFVYDGNGQLTNVNRPGPDTAYTYTGHRGAMTKIAETSGESVDFSYDAEMRVTAIRRLAAGQHTWTTFSYGAPATPCNPTSDAGRTLVTDNSGAVTIYCYDRTLHITGQHQQTSYDTSRPEYVDPDPDPSDAEDDAADPVPSTTCDPDPELGDWDYCDQTDDPAEPAARAVVEEGLHPDLEPGGAGWGISEPRTAMFGDASFDSLAPKHARLIVGWDTAIVAATDGHANQADANQRILDMLAYIEQARLKSIDVTVTLQHSDYRTTYLPLPSEYALAFREYLGKLPTTRYWTPWNEPNISGQPTSYDARYLARLALGDDPERAAELSGGGARRAAQFYKAMKSECATDPRGCLILAGDFVDTYNLIRSSGPLTGPPEARVRVRDEDGNVLKFNGGWSFYRAYIEGLGGGPKKAQPRHWAIHPYKAGEWDGSTDDKRITPFRRFVDRTNTFSAGSRVWITEYGQRTLKEQCTKLHFGDDKLNEPSRARNLRRILSELDYSNRITRFYYYRYYDWNVGFNNRDCWASGLFTPGPLGNGVGQEPRCLYFIYRYMTNPTNNSPATPASCPSSAALNATP